MRIAALIAVSLLAAGCSHAGVGGSGQPHPSTHPSTHPSSSQAPISKAPAAVPAPTTGTPIAAVIAWIEAGRPADPGRYHTAIKDGVTAQLGADTAFSVPGSKAKCTTDTTHTGNALACLVELAKPPPQPETAYGEWKGGWVDFDGTALQIGSARADPGAFISGTGTELAVGDSLSFPDFRCRADQTGLFCVNYAHQAAARLSSAGVEPYGCLRAVPPPDGVGAAFNCS